jgi:hypothetical protein
VFIRTTYNVRGNHLLHLDDKLRLIIQGYGIAHHGRDRLAVSNAPLPDEQIHVPREAVGGFNERTLVGWIARVVGNWHSVYSRLTLTVFDVYKCKSS